MSLEQIVTLVNSLREFADWLEDHPDLPVCPGAGSFYMWCRNAKEMAECAVALGMFKKSACDKYLNATRYFGPIEVQATIRHEYVCEKIITTKVVPALPERVLPAEPERTIEVVKWICPESILDLKEHHNNATDAVQS